MSNKPGNFITTSESGIRRGYWLVRSSDKERFFISEKISVSALERVCDRVLNESTGWDYWIDYCLGLDVKGRVAWSNIEQSDSFMP